VPYSTDPGHIGWLDLTVADAEGLRDFYTQVAGWQTQSVDMGTYSDFAMTTGDGSDAVAGVCHARGENAELPPAWLIYINVPDLDAAIAEAQARGGTLIAGPRGETASGRFAVLRDPAGAAFALFQHPPEGQ
jgi:predicted enzyme related to lactoylglutathione lyase